MERIKFIINGILMICCIGLLAFLLSDLVILFIDRHPDDNFYTKQEVVSHCNFDLSKTKFSIDTLNSGLLTLRYKEYDLRVQDRANNYIDGNDTCYLKMRAHKFWMNSLK